MSEKEWGLKDRINVVLSTVALILSIAVAIMSKLQSSADNERTLRLQLTNTLSDLISDGINTQKMFLDAKGENPAMLQQISNAASYKHAFLVKQAKYLSERIAPLVTPPEYVVIAWENADIGDIPEAILYFEKGIVIAQGREKAIIMRDYAQFLFSIGKLEKGRELFSDAVKITQESGADPAKADLVAIYSIWSGAEAMSRHDAEAVQKQREAEAILATINDTAVRSSVGNYMNNMLAGKANPSFQTPPFTQPK